MIATPSASASIEIESRYDMSGNGIIQSADALQVVNKINTLAAGACGVDYKFDISGNGIVQTADALQVVNKINADVSTTAGCVGP
jgi:hypothetical protein